MTATSNPFIKLLGETLVNNKLGKVQTDDLSSNEVVGLYFSAHWCGPCRGFTPKLIESYNKMKADGKKLEIVFVSADRSDGDFAKYFGTMPWLAVPFENTEIIDKLNSKYQVRGIPTLIFLKNDGKILSKDGRDVIAEDPTGKDFPWPPKNVLDLLAGDVVDHQDKHIPVSEILKTNDAIGIYFSAHWCPPCRAFTPILASLYKKLTAEGKKFEILFASSDKSQKEFNEYFHEMPWKAIPFPDRERKEKLSRFFGVEGIPTFIMLDPSGKIINDNERGEVSEDPEGKNFPWPAPEPVPLNQLNSPLVEKINEAPTFLILLDKTENSQVQSYVDLVQPIAAEIFNKNKTLDEDDDTPRMIFFYGTKDHEMAANLRGFFNPKNQTEPLILISDIPRQKKYLFQDKEVNATTIKNFVEGYFSKTLQGVGIKS